MSALSGGTSTSLQLLPPVMAQRLAGPSAWGAKWVLPSRSRARGFSRWMSPLMLQTPQASKLPKLSHALSWTQLSTSWKFQGLKLLYIDADWVCQMLSAKKVVKENFLNMSKHLIFTFSRRKCFGLEMRECFILIFPVWQRSDCFLSKWQVLCCSKLTKFFPVSEPFYFKDPE